jgi:hypothetical protein
MNQKTPFGMLHIPSNTLNSKLEAVHRALEWCDTLLSATSWTKKFEEDGVSLLRTINHRTINVYPLEAAKMDLGLSTRFAANHLPVQIDEKPVCVRAVKRKPQPLHTDMVAGMILLLGGVDFNPAAVPETMHSILTPDQREALPTIPRRPRYVPGQPSTSGRIFLSEDRILNLLNEHGDDAFHVQFEKRDGTLRNMTARLDVQNSSEGDVEHEAHPPRPYNPADYHLMPVIDLRLNQPRNMATDRVTRLAIADQVLSTESAEQ